MLLVSKCLSFCSQNLSDNIIRDRNVYCVIGDLNVIFQVVSGVEWLIEYICVKCRCVSNVEWLSEYVCDRNVYGTIGNLILLIEMFIV